MDAGRDGRNKGEWSPDYSIVIRGWENSIIKDNVIQEGSLKELIVDRGEHDENVVVKNNVRSLKSLKI